MCLFPLTASLKEDGGRPILNKEGTLKLPCGKCSECISKRALEWATRARHEISCHKENSFITLTYNEESIPSNFIIKSDFQKFVKKLRKKLKQKITYMVSYEYGSKNFRPHMHAIFFGYNPNNQKFLKNTPSGYPLTTSQEVDDLWGKGFHSIGTANEKTAYYIATYALKGKTKTVHHPITGEQQEISDSMDVSKRPATGRSYLLKNAQQLVDSGDQLPRYYAKCLQEYSEIYYQSDKEISALSERELRRRKKVLQDFSHINPDLFEEYQNNLYLKISTRPTQERYAKFIIDSQKNCASSTNYRGGDQTPLQRQQEEFHRRQLKNERDDYVSFIRSKIK